MQIGVVQSSNLKNSNNGFSESLKKNSNFSQFSKVVPLRKDTVSFSRNVSFKAQENSADNFEFQGGSFLEYLKNSNNSAFSVRNFLDNVMKNDKLSKKFIEEMTAEPEKSVENAKILEKKLGGRENFLEWYFSNNGYVKSYEKYLRNKYTDAESIEELLKIQPNWGYWALERKKCALGGYSYLADELMRDRSVDFTIGTVPKPFGGISDYKKFMIELKKVPFMAREAYCEADGNVCRISQLQGGDLSYKNIYKISVGEKEYIIKKDRFCPENFINNLNPYVSRSAKEGRLLRGDSVFADACMDYYLQANGCRTNAEMLFYDFETNSAVYEFLHANNSSGKSEKFLEQINANKQMGNINKLGVYLNDLGDNFNCYKDEKGKTRLIDIGHGEFIDIFKPGARMLTVEMPNYCGFSIKNALAGLSLADFNAATATNLP